MTSFGIVGGKEKENKHNSKKELAIQYIPSISMMVSWWSYPFPMCTTQEHSEQK